MKDTEYSLCPNVPNANFRCAIAYTETTMQFDARFQDMRICSANILSFCRRRHVKQAQQKQENVQSHDFPSRLTAELSGNPVGPTTAWRLRTVFTTKDDNPTNCCLLRVLEEIKATGMTEEARGVVRWSDLLGTG